eukprot:1130039-Rhodomonas_salina.2
MPGTDKTNGAMWLCARYAMTGTDLAFGDVPGGVSDAVHAFFVLQVLTNAIPIPGHRSRTAQGPSSRTLESGTLHPTLGRCSTRSCMSSSFATLVLWDSASRCTRSLTATLVLTRWYGSRPCMRQRSDPGTDAVVWHYQAATRCADQGCGVQTQVPKGSRRYAPTGHPRYQPTPLLCAARYSRGVWCCQAHVRRLVANGQRGNESDAGCKLSTMASTDRVAGTARGRVQASVYGARLLAVVEVQAAVRRKLCSGELVRTAASVLQTCVRRTVAPFNPKSWTLDPRP